MNFIFLRKNTFLFSVGIFSLFSSGAAFSGIFGCCEDSQENKRSTPSLPSSITQPLIPDVNAQAIVSPLQIQSANDFTRIIPSSSQIGEGQEMIAPTASPVRQAQQQNVSPTTDELEVLQGGSGAISLASSVEPPFTLHELKGRFQQKTLKGVYWQDVYSVFCGWEPNCEDLSTDIPEGIKNKYTQLVSKDWSKKETQESFAELLVKAKNSSYFNNNFTASEFLNNIQEVWQGNPSLFSFALISTQNKKTGAKSAYFFAKHEVNLYYIKGGGGSSAAASTAVSGYTSLAPSRPVSPPKKTQSGNTTPPVGAGGGIQEHSQLGGQGAEE